MGEIYERNKLVISNFKLFYRTYLIIIVLTGIKDPETGQAPTDEKEFPLFALKYATHKLWDPAAHEGGDQFSGWEGFKTAGVWNSDPYPYRKRWGAMKTKTEMFEFYSETLKEALRFSRRLDEEQLALYQKQPCVVSD